MTAPTLDPCRVTTTCPDPAHWTLHIGDTRTPACDDHATAARRHDQRYRERT